MTQGSNLALDPSSQASGNERKKPLAKHPEGSVPYAYALKNKMTPKYVSTRTYTLANAFVIYVCVYTFVKTTKQICFPVQEIIHNFSTFTPYSLHCCVVDYFWSPFTPKCLHQHI